MNDRHITIVLEGLDRGSITETEADAYLRRRCGTTLARARMDAAVSGPVYAPLRTPTTGVTLETPATPFSTTPKGTRTGRNTIIAAAIGMVLFASIFLLFLNGEPTGLVTHSISGKILQANANDSIPVGYTVTGLRVNGTLSGEGSATIRFETPTGTLLVGTITSDNGAPRTDKASYAPGDAITVQNAPADATYYFDDGTTSTAVTLPFAATTGGTLLAVANASDGITTYKLPIIIGEATRTTESNGLCVETCAMNATNGTLRIETSGDVTLDIHSVAIEVPSENRPPELAVPFAPITINETTDVALTPHFIDPDGDALLFSAGTSPLMDVSVNGSTLTLTPVASGNATLEVYASDMQSLVPATLRIEVIAPTILAENTTENATDNATNGTSAIINDTIINDTIAAPENASANNTASNTTDNSTVNITAPNTDACADPNPNLRPAYCFAGNEEAVFEELVAPMRDRQLRTVGRMTRYGNLVIRGVLREHSDGAPDGDAFSVGNTVTQNFQDTYTPTAWIDSSSGDLHLRGVAHQEQANVVPPQYGSYIIQNGNGLVLAYIDRQTGDLYLRGDVVQLGKLQ